MSKKITLISSEGQTFDVEEVVAVQSELIKDMIDDDCIGDVIIPFSKVTTKILTIVIDYCKKHSEIGISDEELNTCDLEFLQVDIATLMDLVLAANYLNIKSLLDLTCQTLADMIKGKTPQEIRRTFNIKDNFTPEEEEEVRRENQWAFE